MPNSVKIDLGGAPGTVELPKMKDLSDAELLRKMKSYMRHWFVLEYYPSGYDTRPDFKDPFDIEAERRGHTLYKNGRGKSVFQLLKAT
ncbi:hypothetical protein DdX_12964 [Ditylenchus destructor]|uniref:Uncharacterized protein n=1 Tax=Ditylenchus destructor TaxID=166010 RepID=A0AAD4MZH6_9BILA|nr:hypothetical protein DdX_12964 [Ditylenchus destructor]